MVLDQSYLLAEEGDVRYVDVVSVGLCTVYAAVGADRCNHISGCPPVDGGEPHLYAAHEDQPACSRPTLRVFQADQPGRHRYPHSVVRVAGRRPLASRTERRL